MEVPDPAISCSLGAMGSLLVKLRSLLGTPGDQLPEPLKPHEEQLEVLKQDLQGINTLLADVSRAEAPNTVATLWMNEVRDLSYDIEDYIDKTMRSSSNSGEEIPSVELQEFTTLVKQASRRYHMYRHHLGESNPLSMVDGRIRLPAICEQATDLVGIGESKAKLINLLSHDQDAAEQRMKVVSVLGPMGVGKTTLALQVFREMGGQFECRAFVRASRTPDTRMILRSITSQVQRHEIPRHGLRVQELIDNLRKHLQQKRYFIVIDGLCETMSWDIVYSAFPEDTHDSRILITTDIEEVALECCDYESDAIFKAEPLGGNFSAELFFNRMLSFKHECSEQMKGNTEEIIRTCSGLPLATISIATILASQPDDSEAELWQRLKECLSSRMRNNLTSEGMLREIVGLSYHSLSNPLKTCLLYLSMYPEGYTFLKAELVKQWSAEGFIIADAEEYNIEVAECYFDELVCRGLIQPNHINISDGMIFYTVHSTVFEVISNISIEENFSTVIDYSNTITKLSAKVRRLSLRFSNAKYATKPEGIAMSPVRSLIFYGLVECLPSIMKFEVLRVLILEFWGDQEELDLSGIGRLFQLRYVKITTDITVKLPATMCGLLFLETLQIDARMTAVPSDIVHLPSLLHLHINAEISLPDGIAHMRSLRTLHFFDLSRNSEDNARSLGEMTKLHDLHLTCSTAWSNTLKGNLIALFSSLGKNDKLKALVFAPVASCTSIYLDFSSSVPSLPIFLQRLELLPPICMFSRLPRWIGQLRNLCILKIVVRELTSDDVDSIAGLQELTVLCLYVSQPTAERIIFNRAAFSVLKYFKFRCSVLRLAFQAETMPNLQKLKLEFNDHCGEQNSNMLSGIQHLFNLLDISARIGAAPSAVEQDRMSAESLLKHAISKHPRKLSINIRWVKWFDEEISQNFDQQQSSSHLEDLEVEPPSEFSFKYQEAEKASSESELSVPEGRTGPSSPGLVMRSNKEQKCCNKIYLDPPPEISLHGYSKHTLKLVSTTGVPFVCEGCKEPGDGPRYRCYCGGGSSFDLHTCCALAEKDTTLVHPLFGDSAFVFLFVPPPPESRRVCDACGEAARGFLYHCSAEGLDLHPSCAWLPERIPQGDRVFELHRQAPGQCVICPSPSETLRVCGARMLCTYRTYFHGESVDLHVACIKEMARPSGWKCRDGAVECGDTIVQAITDRVLHNLLHCNRKSGFDQFCKIVGAVGSIIVQVVFGNHKAIL